MEKIEKLFLTKTCTLNKAIKIIDKGEGNQIEFKSSFLTVSEAI